MNPAIPSILMFCNTFTMGEESKGLMRELADALARQGATVQVCWINWAGPTSVAPRVTTLPNGIKVLVVAPWKIGWAGPFIANASKWIGSSFVAKRAVKQHLGRRHVDLLLDFSPLVITARLILWAKRRFRCRGYAYLTDFFPYHQRGAAQNIGGSIGFRVGVRLETLLLQHFETIACMSPAGIDFVKRHYALKRNQSVRLLHLWGETFAPPPQERTATRAAHELPSERPIILFGGQIAEGRGIEELLEVARLAEQMRPELLFLFMGSGRLEPLVRARIASGCSNVVLRPPVARDDYLSLVSACDVGVVSTVAGTGVPTFPSKTIDYLRAGVPIVASVEDTTDYGRFVEENGFGVATAAGDPGAFLAAIFRVVDDPNAFEHMVLRGKEALHRYFDANRAAATILAQAFGDCESNERLKVS